MILGCFEVVTEVSGKRFAMGSMCSDGGHGRGRYEEALEGEVSDGTSNGMGWDGMMKLHRRIFEIINTSENRTSNSKFGVASLRRSRSRIALQVNIDQPMSSVGTGYYTRVPGENLAVVDNIDNDIRGRDKLSLILIP
jgi:hypothetical protein